MKILLTVLALFALVGNANAAYDARWWPVTSGEAAARATVINLAEQDLARRISLPATKGALEIAQTVGKGAITVGGAGLARKAIGRIAGGVPYIGIGLTLYEAYRAYQDAQLQQPDPRSANPHLRPFLFVDNGDPNENTAAGDVLYNPLYGDGHMVVNRVEVRSGNCYGGGTDKGGFGVGYDVGVVKLFENYNPARCGSVTPWEKYTLFFGSQAAPGSQLTLTRRPDAEIASKLGTPNGGVAPIDSPDIQAEVTDMFNQSTPDPALAGSAWVDSNVDTIRADTPTIVAKQAADSSQRAADNAQQAATTAINNYNNRTSYFQQVQNTYNADPTAENLAKLEQAKKDMEQAQLDVDQTTVESDRAAAEAARDAAASPDSFADPGIKMNEYDATLQPPEKKGIQALIEQFISSSPVAALVRSFSFDLQAGSCSEPLFTAYDRDYLFDLCPYEAQIATMGTVILAFAHVAALYILFRKGGGE